MAQQTIDVHSHNVLPEFTEFLERHGAAMEETFPLPKWDVNSHLEFMEAAGIRTSLLSMPAPQPYFGDTEGCRQIVRQYNEACAKLKADYPGKSLFCALLPLPDVGAAIEEAVYALDTLGADGIVRLSKIEVYPQHLDEYMKYAAEVGEVSLRTESGMLKMYAVQEKEDPCKITILETYASRAAYEKHIASEHFQKYKQGTLHMVKSLVLSDQTPLNPANRINNFIQ